MVLELWQVHIKGGTFNMKNEKKKLKRNFAIAISTFLLMCILYGFLLVSSLQFLNKIMEYPDAKFTNKMVFIAITFVLVWGYILLSLIPKRINITADELVKLYRKL